MKKLLFVLPFLFACSVAFGYDYVDVSGKVKNMEGMELEDVVIRLDNDSDHYRATTDWNGDFELYDVVVNTYTVTCEKQGYITSTQEITINGDSYEMNIGSFYLEKDIASGMSGAWEGYLKTCIWDLDVSITITQTDDIISGTILANGRPFGKLTGTVSGDDIEFEIEKSAPCRGFIEGNGFVTEEKIILVFTDGMDCQGEQNVGNCELWKAE
ncbi:carboxypeptidase-like regulatory domain-containing protein [Candidatus Kuenenia sp.]|uniref:carboxypeptidase-like regulatory domain-containing protein n=1 Tax=Candidatus Kuenenia sp. TaxID=2499824 RepID=UPI0032203663